MTKKYRKGLKTSFDKSVIKLREAYKLIMPGVAPEFAPRREAIKLPEAPTKSTDCRENVERKIFGGRIRRIFLVCI